MDSALTSSNGNGDEVTLRAFGATLNLKGRHVIAFVCLLMIFGAILGLAWLSGGEHRAMAEEHRAVVARIAGVEKSVGALAGSMDELRLEGEIHSFLLTLSDSEKPRYRLLAPAKLRERMLQK